MPHQPTLQWCDSVIKSPQNESDYEFTPAAASVLDTLAQAVGQVDEGEMNLRESFGQEFKSAALIRDRLEHVIFNSVVRLDTDDLATLKADFLEAIESSASPDLFKATEAALSLVLAKTGDARRADAPRNASNGGNRADLLGEKDENKPWLTAFPRIIRLAALEDVFDSETQFTLLETDVMPLLASFNSPLPIWMWLTQHPGTMARFSEQITGGFPANVCAMTTLSGPDQESFERLRDLKNVKTSIRGLLIEPLLERIPPENLDLNGIHWVIVGGKSGSSAGVTSFPIEWAVELRRHCEAHGVTFFLNQIGSNPSKDGKVLDLKDKQGSDWDEWDKSDKFLKMRAIPQIFQDCGQKSGEPAITVVPVAKKRGKSQKPEILAITPEQKEEFKHLDKIVRKGAMAFIQMGQALSRIHDGKLWKAGPYKGWKDYCRSVAGISKSHAHRYLQASRFIAELSKMSPIGDVLANLMPTAESQLRPLFQLAEPPQQVQAWITAVRNAGGKSPIAAEVAEVVFEILHPEGQPEKQATRAGLRKTLIAELKEVVRMKNSWVRVEEMLARLEKLG